MKIIIIKNNLKEGLDIVQRAVGDSVNLPILKNILLEAENNQIKLITTNLEIAINYIISGKIIENGKIVVPFQIFNTLINNLQSERINLEGKNNNLEITADNYQAKIIGSLIDEYPIIPKIKEDKKYIKIESLILKDALEQVLVGTQFSDLRQELNNVLIDFSLDNLKLAGTDSFRLTEKTLNTNQFETNIQDEFKILLPLKTAQELIRILKNEEPLNIKYDHNQIVFTTERLNFISRLGEGNFPDYEAIIPKSFENKITINRQEFINAVKLISTFSNRSNEIRVKSSKNKNVIEIFSADQTTGENHYLIAAKFDNEISQTGFNWRYLLDGLRVLRNEEILFNLNAENKPAMLKSPEDTSYFYILMPILNS